MTSIMSVQTAEALIITVVQRNLEKVFPRLQSLTLDDGTTVFLLTGESKFKLHREPELLSIVVERVLAPALNEVCGRSRINSIKLGDIDFNNVRPRSLHDFLSTSAAAESLLDAFPSDLSALPLEKHAGIAKMLTLLYNDVIDETASVAVVGQFPSNMCKMPDSPQLPAAIKAKLPRACRIDCVLGGCIVVSATAGTPADASTTDASEKLAPSVALRARDFAKVLVPHSTTALDDKLPEQWRHKSFSLEEVEDILGAVAQSIVAQWNTGMKNDQNRTVLLTLLRTVSQQLRDFLRDQLLLESTEVAGVWRMSRAAIARVAKVGRMWQRTSHHDVARRLEGWDGPLPRTVDERFTEFVQRIDSVAKIRLIVERAAAVMGVAMSGGRGVPSELMDVNPTSIFSGKSATDSTLTLMSEWEATVQRWHAAFNENHKPRLTAKVASAWKSLTDPQTIFSFVEENEELIIELMGSDATNPEIDPLIRQLVAMVEAKIDESQRQVSTNAGGAAISRMAAFRNSVAEIAPITAACSRVIERGQLGDALDQKLNAHLDRARAGIQEALTSWCADTSKRMIGGVPVVVTVLVSQTEPDDITTTIMQCSFNPEIEHIMSEAAELLGMTNTPFSVVPISSTSASSSSSAASSMGAAGRGDNVQLLVPYEALSLSEEATRSFAEVERVHRAFYRLRQQCVVFNTLTTRQIVPCTRPLFSAVIGKCVQSVTESTKPVSKLTFGPKNSAQLENIVVKLQSALEQAAQEWLAVRKLHAELGNMIINLFDVDLVNAQEKWKDVLKDMRNALEGFERQRQMVLAKGSKEIEQLPTYKWKVHWDAQLFKALEHQYQRGLLVLNEQQESVQVELRVKNGQVVFHPGYEKLRKAYYDRIRDFVNIPNRFKGLANSTFFADMPGRNGDSITEVHVRAMDLFARLNRVRKQFRDHVSIGLCGFSGSWNLDDLVVHLVTTHAQWDAGFKLVKDRLKRTAQIEDKVKVDCIEINTTPIKAAIEDQLRRLEESLLVSLRKASQKQLAMIDSFVLGAANVVERQPATLEELGQMNKSMEEVKRKLPEMAKMMEEQESLTKLLRGASSGSASSGGSSSSGGSIVAMTADFSLTKSRWDHLQDAMSSHAKQMSGSVAKLRSNVEGMVNKFVRDLDRFMKSWTMHRPKDAASYKSRHDFVERALAPARDRAAEFEELRAAGKDMLEKCDFFGVSGPDMTAMTDAEEEVTTTMAQYKFFEELDATVEQLGKEDWLTFRTRAYQFDDLLKKWSKKFKLEVMNVSEEAASAPLSDNEVNHIIAQSQQQAARGTAGAAFRGDAGNEENGAPSLGVVAAFTAKQILEWRGIYPMLRFVRGDGYLSEHWLEMFGLLEFEKGMTSDALRLSHFLEKSGNILKKEPQLKALASRAGGEVIIRDALQELRQWSLDAKFTLVKPPDGTTARVMLISEWKEVLTQVSDHQALLGSLKTSEWFGRFAEEATGFEHRLLNVQEFSNLLMNTQRRWLYLEPLFARGALPQEQTRFKRVDKEFVGILKEIEADPRVMTLAQHDDYGDKLKAILDQIDRCQKALNEFLEQKRNKFPRFYFISDDDLLEILGQSKNPNVIQSHLKKLFQGIHSVIFNNPKEATAITHMVSSEGEQVLLREAVPITDPNVEEWLILLDRSMRGTLADLLVRCAATPFNEVFKSMRALDTYPSQILQAAGQLGFSKAMEAALANTSQLQASIGAVKSMLATTLQVLTDMDYAEGLTLAAFNNDKSRFDTARNVREFKIKPIITDMMHYIEVTETILAASPTDLRWLWQKQLRYYLEDYKVDYSKLSPAAQLTHFEFAGKRAVVKMADTSFHYTYEYQGNAAKLVHTALTDVAYLTILKGAKLGFGTNLEGPAGTGKTETVKMLSCSLARMTVVFNCISTKERIDLADGTSILVSDLPDDGLDGDEHHYSVNAHNGDKGFVRARIVNKITRPQLREVLKVNFIDGRSITCTPDHKFLLANGEWCKAADLLNAEGGSSSSVMMGVAGTPRAAISQRDRAWTLPLAATAGVVVAPPLSLDTHSNIERTLTMVRTLGYALASTWAGATSSNKQTFVEIATLGSKRDAMDMKADWESHAVDGVAEESETKKKKNKARTSFSLRLRGPDAIALRNIIAGAPAKQQQMKSYSSSSLLPDFVTDSNCPLIVLQAFLSGFLGSGAMMMMQDNNNSFGQLQLSQSVGNAKHAASVRHGMTQLVAMLARLDVPARICVDQPAKSSHQIVGIAVKSASDITTFMDKIGVAYSGTKRVQCAAAASYYRYVLNRCESTSAVVMTPELFLERTGARSLFVNNNNNNNNNTGADEENQTTTLCMPAMKLEVLGVECCKTMEEVFDVTVDEHHNFTVNGMTVHNCDGAVDVKSMTRVLTGIAKCGAWGCFDEFNRMKVDQLSAVSQVIQSIQEALKLEEATCILLGKQVDVHPATGIYVTMNPASKKYGGRSRLPDNLKQLLRTVAMSVPDTVPIAETMLLSEGFRFVREIAPRVVEVYRLSKQLLSAQQHYDWGLRPLKAVLRMGGSLVQTMRRNGETEARTSMIEGELLVQSLRVNTLSKLTFDDVKLFNGIISDVFPRVSPKAVDYEELEGALGAAAVALGLEESPTQIAKALQLHEAMNQRMGVLCVGPPGSGKSTLVKLLRKAYQSLGTTVETYVMNPKAVTREQLLGKMDPDTREWQDGILSAAARKVVGKPLTERQFIICDGDVDPEWIEALNSVLDDNKLLTLPTGVRIQFGNNINFVFETHSLQYASPATVSRLGIIFLSENDVQAHFLLKSFVAHRLTEEQKKKGVVVDMMQTYILDAVDEVVDLDPEALCVPGTSRPTMIRAALTHTAGAQNKFDFAARLVRALTAFVAGNDSKGVEYRKKLAAAIFTLLDEKPVSGSSDPLDAVFEESSGKPRALKAADASDTVDIVRCAVTGETPIIHTLEAMRILNTLDGLVNPAIPFPAGEGGSLQSFPPFFLVGPEGCGKSVLLHACFDHLKAKAQQLIDAGASPASVAGISNIKVVTITCSAQTTASQVLQKLQQSCVMSTSAYGKVLRPKEADRLVLCLKNVALPRPDKYGTVMLHSLLQQLLLYHGFYDAERDWVGIDRIQIVGTMTNSANRAPVSPRLLSLVNIVSVPHPDSKSMTGIFSALFRALLATPQFRDGRQYDGGKELATLVTSVYSKVQKRFSGEEYKFCAFSPRDVTQWVLSIPRYDMGATSLLECIAYEGTRMVCDRLPRQEDRGKAERYLSDNLKALGATLGGEKESERKIFATWQSDWVPTTGDSATTITAGVAGGVPGSRGLKPITIEQVKTQLEDCVIRYQREFGDLPLNLIPETLQWVVRIDRAISRTGGHAVLVGRAGMGRRHAVIAAGYMIKCEIVRFNIGRDYGMKQFRIDLKAAITKAATGVERVLLLVEDFNIVDESFLEMINSLIAAGEVPGLFTSEETESLVSQLRDEMGTDTTGFTGTPHQYVVRRVQRHLRVCLLMDPTHPMFGVRCQSNPAILSRCAVLWTDTFTSDGLTQLAQNQLQEVVGSIRAREDGKSKPFDAIYEVAKIHRGMIKDTDAPPEAFKALLTSFQGIFQSRARASGDAVDRLEQGLAKLGDAEQQVAGIRERVGAQKKEMELRQAEAQEAMTQIHKSLEDAAAQRTRAEDVKEELTEKQVEITKRKAHVDAALSTIEPTLREAAEAVKGLSSATLSDIRRLSSPPPVIKDVLEGVLALLGKDDNSWAGMRKFLGDRDVVDQILRFDANTVSKATRDAVSKLVEQHADSFKPEMVRRAFVAAAPLAQWVTANLEHSIILEQAGPLRKELDELLANAKRGEEKLEKLNAKVAKLDEKVQKLREDHQKKISQANDLEEQVAKAEAQLDQAEKLLVKLTGEKGRWREQSASIRADQAAMPRRALACAAFMTYLGGESEDGRAATMKLWAERLKLDKPTTLFSTFMRTESELLKYKSEGLPGDSLSIENAVSMLDAPRTPLVVDPAGQAQEWLAAHLRGKEGVTVEIASSGDDRFSHIVELAVRFGKTLLVTDVDRIEPLLFNVLRRDLQSAGPKKVVQIGPRQVDWQDSFKLYLFCRAANDLRLPPDAAALVTLVNFTATRAGLEDQLLGKTIQHEQPQLEEQKMELLKREEALKMDLAKLEESLLRDLATSHGNLLENTALIESLNNIKAQAGTIHEGLEQSRRLSEDLDQKRNVYRPLAAASSTLYFLFGDLVALSRMYQFSLPSFNLLFHATLAEGKKLPESTQLKDKIATLSADIVRRSFFFVSRGLFKADRVTFAVHILNGLYPQEFPRPLWNVLCGRSANAAGGPAFIGSAASPADGAGAGSAFAGESPAESPLNPASPAGAFVGEVTVPAWATNGNPIDIKAGLKRVATAIPDFETRWKLSDDAGWRAWMQSPNSYADIFQRMPTLCDAFLFMSVFARAQMLQCMAHATKLRLQISDLALVESIESVIAHTSASVPILLITSSGADPSLELQSAAYKVVGRQRVTQIALGGGQTDEARMQLQRCAQCGDWLVLKNVHLVLDWAQSVLEKEIGQLTNAHEEFRLWLTTEPHDQFPTVLLRSSLKMTFESPPGVRSNVLSTLRKLPPPPPSATPLGGSLVFALLWFHALLSERRTYIPQGWTKMYEFTLADAGAAADVLYALSSGGQVDWAFVRGMLNQAIYGGRLDALQDVRVLSVFLQRVFKDATVVSKSEPLFRQLSVPASLAAASKEVQEKLPDVDPPAVFCLPDNADIVVHELAASNSLAGLKSLGQGVQLSGRLSADAVKALLMPVVSQFWRQGRGASAASPADAGAAGAANPNDTPMGEIPHVPQIGEMANSSSPRRNSFRRSSSIRASSTLGLLQGSLPDPLEVFICSEIALIVAIMTDVTATFTKACEVVDGMTLAGPELIAVAAELSTFSTPDKWQDRMPGPTNLQQWVALLRLRAKRVIDWHSKFAGANTLLSEKLDMADLARPQTFLNALRQHTARKTGNELVQLTLNSSTVAGSSLSSGKSVSVTLSGASLSIQGGTVNPATGKLAPVGKSAASTAPFVDLQLAWVLSNEVPATQQGQTVKVPLYSDASRETLVADVYLNCEAGTADDWVLRGTALILVQPLVIA